MKTRKFTVILAIILSLVLSASFSAAGSSISDLNKQKDSIKAQVGTAKDLRDDVKTERSEMERQALEIDAEIEDAENELLSIESDLMATQNRLAEARAELAAGEENKETQYEALKERLRYMYENGNVGYLEIILDSKNIGDFLNRMEYVKLIVEYDGGILDKYEETLELVKNRIDEINAKQQEISALQTIQERKIAELNVKLEQKNELIAALISKEDTYAQQIASLEASSKQIENAIKEIERKKAAEAAAKKAAEQAAAERAAIANFNGKLGWPVPNTTYISSPYGWRNSPISGKREFHTGIDIAKVSKGDPIVAAESGKVILATYASGYGNYMVIDHGGGISTLYAHASALLLSVGDSVQKGQQIAKIGSTGYSTGNHLHFEVRVNGAHTDPRPYLGY